MTSYSKARLSSSLGAETTLEFPVLEIFNGDGILIYRSHELGQNADSLRKFWLVFRTFSPCGSLRVWSIFWKQYQTLSSMSKKF